METFRLKRSKIAGFTDRSSGNKVVSTIPAFREGNRQVQKQRNFPKLASDSSSCSSDTSDEDPFTFEQEWRSSKGTFGTPMKKLLAQEMSRETESKRRSPSVIARLMGLDGLPPQQRAHKQQKKSTENYQQRPTSAEKAQWSGTFHGRRSFRKKSKEEQEFKDVFEVFDASKVESSSYSSQGAGNSKLTEAEMAFVQQKFMDVKRLSTDEKLQDSKEFHDALEVLDSNKDLLLKFLQQPDSLFTKHLHDLQGALPQSHCGRLSDTKSSYAPKYGSSGLSLKSEREIPWKSNNKSPQKHHDGLLSHRHSRHVANNSLKSSKIELEVKNGSALVPTRIVVLKPNLGKAQNATRTVSSPRSSHDFRTDCRLTGTKNREAESRGKKFPEDVSLTRHKSRESREIAKEITRHMRSSFSSGSMNFSTSGFRGYAGDESSCDISRSESANESEMTTVTSRADFNWKKQYQSSPLCSTESSVSREAKKRLSERWKLTHKSEELGVVSRGSTLGEMLTIPDREVSRANFNGVIGKEGFSEKFSSDDGPTRRVEPLGISSRDGWKDGCIQNLSRSRSLPASSAAVGSPKTSMHHENHDDRFMMTKESMKRERTNSVKGNSNHRKDFLSRNSRSSSKKSHSSHCTHRESNDYSPEINFSQNQENRNFKEDGGPSEPNPVASETHSSIPTEANSVTENVVNVGHEKIVSSEHSHLELSSPTFLSNFSAGGLDVLRSQEPSGGPSKEVPSHHPVPELQSPANAKESDQPSPVSVLEAPFPDDLSYGSECFESLSADLHGLRMQLQLLKLESEAYDEGPMVVSSDEYVGEGSVEFADERRIPRAEDCESLYLVDVLIDSGLNDADPDMITATWHSPECPVSPLVFEELEKKYCNLISWSRSERRLLFDRINSKLLEIFQQFTDPRLWVRSATRVGPKWIKKGLELEDTLRKSLTSQDMKANKDAGEKVLTSESQWLDLGDDIDIIGREIEILLTDELVAEILTM